VRDHRDADNNPVDFYYPLDHGASKLEGMLADAVEVVQEKQLKEEVDWKSFVEAFRGNWDNVYYNSPSAGPTTGWSAEFWGKVMRGACFVYEYSQDEELYDVLREAVVDLLSVAADDKGGTNPERIINSATGQFEFTGLAIWNIKYVLLGLEYFYEVCPEPALKEDIMEILVREADYVCKYIGDSDEPIDPDDPSKGNKIPINKTCNHFRSATSISILEPMVRMYQMTKDQKYLDFSEYILAEGDPFNGSTYYGNIFEHAKQGVFPYQYFD
jgi:hypothetical protein